MVETSSTAIGGGFGMKLLGGTAKYDGPIDLDQWIGRRIRDARKVEQIAQEDLAARARTMGLAWTRSTVAQIETAERQLSRTELLLLPLFLGLELRDLLVPEAHALVALPNRGGDPVLVTTSELEDVVAGHTSALRAGSSRQVGMSQRVERVLADLRASDPAEPGQADHAIAAKLNVSVGRVSDAARSLWGHSATHERNQRLRTRDLEALTANSIGVLKGRITRDLQVEMQAALRPSRRAAKARGR